MLWLLPVAALAAPLDASLVVAFEPHAPTVRQNDTALADYGFVPVGAVILPTWGVRGTLEWPSGLTAGVAMSYGFLLRRLDDHAVPTTTTASRLGYHLGVRWTERVAVGGDVGFASLTHTVGSTRQGGALVYLGPYVAPRVTLRLVDSTGVLEIAASYAIHVPAGPAHSEPLWEEPFRRAVIHGPAIAVQAGLTNRGSP